MPYRSKSSVTVTINGKKFEAHGNNVSVSSGAVYVDGVKIEDGLSGVVDIVWDGPLASLEAEGSVTCGDVHGDVTGGNSVTCKNVRGSVKAGNSVTCRDVGGSCRAGNSVSRR